jgi:hypothetical protein
LAFHSFFRALFDIGRSSVAPRRSAAVVAADCARSACSAESGMLLGGGTGLLLGGGSPIRRAGTTQPRRVGTSHDAWVAS